MPKSITGTKEWATSNFNFISGCSNNCVYCYAKSMAIRFRRKTTQTWQNEELIQAKVDHSYNKKHGIIMYPSSHDITEQHLDYHLIVLKKLLQAGNQLLIVSKPRIAVVKTLCEELKDYKDQILFRFTIGSTDSKILKQYEPGAPTFEERLECLKYAYKAKYQTSISVEPMLDLNPSKIYSVTHKYVTDAIWYGKINRISSILSINEPGNIQIRDSINKLLRSQDNNFILVLYNSFKDNPQVKWKDSIKSIVGIQLLGEKGLDI